MSGFSQACSHLDNVETLGRKRVLQM